MRKERVEDRESHMMERGHKLLELVLHMHVYRGEWLWQVDQGHCGSTLSLKTCPSAHLLPARQAAHERVR